MEMTPLVTMTLPGRPTVLKNSKRIFSRGRGQRAIVLPSSKFMAWEKNAMASLLGGVESKSIDFHIAVTYRFYFANRQAEPDVSNLIEGPQDLLQKAGIIKNDRLIMRVTAEKFFGVGEPRTEIEVYKYNQITK